MPQISRSALVAYSAERMYDLVNDVQAYPEFLPWCGRTWVLESHGSEMVARIEVRKGGVVQAFTTRNSLVRPEKIHLSLVEGPFKSLEGIWRFAELDDNACKVILELNFELSKAIAGIALGPIFSQATGTMVDAFCRRAKDIYG
ncbi:ubiquinone-binding protein [Hahella sp. CCB-MM4]|uniref:type II toxin-antitoxin system RatA family toxin n=1 Tax=Hahella sp. (strain CCB-MM4) TaxID=1926491 RepID=UPI000B9AE44E|nr:type II toxin-antitoxin system RatA family toxin [Hahella sp. CCB-MM4]OZG71684.1 ubiquinone-binding protein [Hahella sp. CCB-MM4]